MYAGFRPGLHDGDTWAVGCQQPSTSFGCGNCREHSENDYELGVFRFWVLIKFP